MQFLRSVLILFWLYSVSSHILLKKDLPRKNFWALLTDKNTIYYLLRSLYSQIQIKLHCLFHRWPRVAWLSFHITWRNWQGRLSWTIPGCFRHAYREGYFWCRRYWASFSWQWLIDSSSFQLFRPGAKQRDSFWVQVRAVWYSQKKPEHLRWNISGRGSSDPETNLKLRSSWAKSIYSAQ